MRTATSPRLAIRTRSNTVSLDANSARFARHARVFQQYARSGGRLAAAPGVPRLEKALEGVERAAVQRLELEEHLPVLDRLGVLDAHAAHDRLDVRLHLVHQLHRLEDAKRLARGD